MNVILFNAIGALLLGLLVFAGNQAVNAVFSMAITASYIAYTIPVVVRYTGGSEFKPGPFNLGIFVRTFSLSSFDVVGPFFQSLPVAISSVLYMTLFTFMNIFV